MQLKQRRSPFSTIYLDLDTHLRVRERSLLRTMEFEVDLRRVTPVPVHVRDTPGGWLTLASMFTLFALVVAFQGLMNWDVPTAVFLCIVGGIALACWSKVWLLHRNLLVFLDRGTQQQVFAILRSSPSEQEVDAFVRLIASQAERPLPAPGASTAEVVAHHLQVLDYLLEVGVLLPDEHHVVRARLERTSSKASVVSLVQGAI